MKLTQAQKERLSFVGAMLTIVALFLAWYYYKYNTENMSIWSFFFKKKKAPAVKSTVGGVAVSGGGAAQQANATTPTATPLNQNLVFGFSYESNYGSNYRPDFKFGTFSVNDGMPVILDAGVATVGNLWNINTAWDGLGFSHITRRTILGSEVARFLALPQSKRAFGFNTDHHVFNNVPITNMSSAQILAAVDAYFDGNPDDTNNGFTSLDYEVSDPTVNVQTQKWIDLINRVKQRSGNGKVTFYGRGAVNAIIYSGQSEAQMWAESPTPLWSQIGNYLDYQNAQHYVGEPFDPSDSGIIREMLIQYEMGNVFAPTKPSAAHLKNFRENYLTPEKPYASATKQISMAMAFVPFFTTNGLNLWGTEAKPQFGQALDDFIAARKVCSMLNDISFDAAPVIPTVVYNGQTYGNWADYNAAQNPSNPSRYSAFVVGTTVPVMVRAIRKGSEGAICLTRVGGSDMGSNTITVTIGNFTKTYTVSDRNWYVYRISGI